MIFQNQLLQALPAQDLKTLAPHLERIVLKAGQRLVRAHRPIDYIYFPETALCSVIIVSGELDLECIVFGRDGMSGTALLVNDESTFDCSVTVNGAALRIPAEQFSEFLGTHPYTVMLLRRYVQAEHIQMAYSGLAGGRTKMELRVARWLLMACDRLDNNNIKITQRDLARLLGVRRPGLTECLNRLEGHRLIKSARGEIRITDRQGLTELAGAPYGDAEREYQRLMGFPPGSYVATLRRNSFDNEKSSARGGH